MSWKKAFALAALVFAWGLVANVGVFVFAYGQLAIPFLSEERRVENAWVIMSVIIPAFAAVASLTGVAVYWLLGTQRRGGAA